MPGAVARTSAFALNNATLPFALKIANLGAEKAMKPRTRTSPPGSTSRAGRSATKRSPKRSASSTSRSPPNAAAGARRSRPARAPAFRPSAASLRRDIRASSAMRSCTAASPFARTDQREVVEEARRGVPGHQLRRTAIGELGRRGQPVPVIDQRVAEPDPQLRVGRIAADRILEDADRILACCPRAPAPPTSGATIPRG